MEIEIKEKKAEIIETVKKLENERQKGLNWEPTNAEEAAGWHDYWNAIEREYNEKEIELFKLIDKDYWKDYDFVKQLYEQCGDRVIEFSDLTREEYYDLACFTSKTRTSINPDELSLKWFMQNNIEYRIEIEDFQNKTVVFNLDSGLKELKDMGKDARSVYMEVTVGNIDGTYNVYSQKFNDVQVAKECIEILKEKDQKNIKENLKQFQNGWTKDFDHCSKDDIKRENIETKEMTK